MNSYSSMLIDALILGFVLYTLIHGTLATYIAIARIPSASPSASQTVATNVMSALNASSGGAVGLGAQIGQTIANNL